MPLMSVAINNNDEGTCSRCNLAANGFGQLLHEWIKVLYLRSLLVLLFLLMY